MNSNKHTKIVACPISYEQVDRNLVKFYSGFVLSVLILSLFTSSKIGIYLISIDFIIRVFIGIKYSPLCKVLTKTLKVVAVKPTLVDSGRKKIAAQVGLLFSVLISVFSYVEWPLLATLFTSMFIFAIALDLIFDYCLACKMKSMYLTYFKKNRSV